MFEYFCVNCGNHKTEDFWECEKCDSESIAEVEIDKEGKALGSY